MIPQLRIALELAENAALLSLGLLGYCQLKDWLRERLPARMAPPLDGLLFGLMGVVSIIACLGTGDAVKLDLRNAVVMTASLLNGPVAGGIAAAVVALFRLSLGGEGAWPGLASLAIAYGLGALDLALRPHRPGTLDGRRIAVAAAAAIFGGAGVAAFWPMPEGLRAAAWAVAPVWLIATPLTILFLAGIAVHFERRRALVKSLAEREGELEAILDNAPVPIFFKDEHGRFRLINRCYEEWFRKPLSEVIGKTVAELYPLKMPYEVADSDRAATTAGAVTYLREQVDYAKSGIEVMQITKFPIRDRAGRFIGLGGFAVDMTELRRAEKALRDNEERYRAIIEHSNDIVAVVDRDGVVLYRNAPEPNPLGYEVDEDRGCSLLDFVHPKDVGTVTEALRSILDTPEGRTHGIHRYRHKDGSWRHIAWSARNALGVPGIEGIIVNARDVTCVRELEAQLLQARKMEAIGQLAGGIAHDFNNILGGILGFTGFLVEDLPPDSAQRRFALKILKASERARDLVQQIVAFSRMGSVERRPCDLVQIIQDTRELLRPSLPSSTEIVVDPSPAPLVAEVNAAQMSQILLNLCVNANDALAEKPGRIHISGIAIAPRHPDYALFNEAVRRVQDGDGAFHVGALDPQRSYARIAVADEGQGIPPDQLERIFEPFYTTKRRGRGTGLGLSVVHGIIMSYDGALSVASRPGCGTVFRIYLPLVAGTCAEPRAPAEPREPELGGSERLLVVDDESMITEMLGIGLARLGYRVETRNDPMEALRLFAGDPRRWDVVISDEMMPNMRGSSLFGKMKEIDPDLRFILCSGFSDEGSEETYRAAGIDAFFHKPASPEQLAAAIRRLAAERSNRS